MESRPQKYGNVIESIKNKPSTIAILPDFAEEDWPSMDLVAEKLMEYMRRNEPSMLKVHGFDPKFFRLATAIPFRFRQGARFNADRLINRFVAYPRQVRQLVAEFELFHVADHTYAALVHSLPAERTGVYCHDLDAFRCLIEPESEPRPWWFRKMARRVLTGMQKASVVFHSTEPVREQILAHGLVEKERLVHAPYGVSEEFTSHDNSISGTESSRDDSQTDRGKGTGFFLDELNGRPWVVHVGSCIPRKRIDVLLDIVAQLRAKFPDLMLVKVSGEFSPDQKNQIKRLGLEDAILHRVGLSRQELAEVYRRAPVVLQPSEMEGFGLPVIEALACGAPVIASDIPVLREVGATAVAYCGVGLVDDWVEQTSTLLANPDAVAPLSVRLAHAATFSWENHARIIADAYLKIAR
ncbi:glycosyltransferase [Novipirellula sp. SH528]|uniref:glycosyltransferase n=1 Tax=Novipirellula sp. SH528 TaxID=3454466 RepID=UPI003FA10ADD